MDSFNIPPLWPKGRPGTVLPSGSCGNGHELTPDNLAHATAELASAAANAGLTAPLPCVAGEERRLRWIDDPLAIA